MNKAKRGELEVPLPVGFVYDAAGSGGARSRSAGPGQHPRCFETFRRDGSAHRHGQSLSRSAGLCFRTPGTAPTKRARDGRARAGARALGPPQSPLRGRVLFRRRRQRRVRTGRSVRAVPREEWNASFSTRIRVTSRGRSSRESTALGENAQADRGRPTSKSRHGKDRRCCKDW